MKVLLVSGSYPPMPCGVGDYAERLARHLATDEGIDVAVLTSVAAAKASPRRPEVLADGTLWRMRDLRSIMKAARGWGPDVVHLQFPTRGYRKAMLPSFLPLAFRSLRFPVIQTWHEPPSRKGLIRYLPNILSAEILVIVEPQLPRSLPRVYQRLLARKEVHFIPVASNIPTVRLSPEERAREKASFGASGKVLVSYFGFPSPPKGIELLFKIADPDSDQLVMLCSLDRRNPYEASIAEMLEGEPWNSCSRATGFLAPEEVARALAASDAAVFPFTRGVASRNASVLAARSQGTLVITTSRDRRGYDPGDHTYYAAPGAVDEMRAALRERAGRRKEDFIDTGTQWAAVARQHADVYRGILALHERNRRP